MSCPCCQLGGRRLPSLPLGYVAKAKKYFGYNNLKGLDFMHQNCTLRPINLTRQERSTPPLEDHEGLQKYLLEHPNVVEEFVLKNVNQEQIEKWLLRKCRKNSGAFKGTDDKRSLSKWKFCVHKDKRNMLEKLTKEVHMHKQKSSIVNELAKNIAHAVHADRYSLYIADDTGKFLTSYSDSSSRSFLSESRMPKQDIETSTTVSAFVARKNELVYVSEILGDDRFPSGTGQDGTDLSVICHPINLANGDLYGVVEFVKNGNSLPFGEEDLEITCSYLTWGSIAVHYGEVAQRLHSHSMIEEFVNNCAQYLLERKISTCEIFEYIMKFAVSATESAHYVMYQNDTCANKISSTFTDIKDSDDIEVQFRQSSNEGVPGHVINTGGIVNIKDAYTCPFFRRDDDVATGFTTKTVLAAPITAYDSIVGVIQLVNKRKGVYIAQDLGIIKLCASYCSLALTHEQHQQDSLKKLNEVELLKEILRYHGKPKKKELREISNPEVIVDVPDDFHKFSFDYFSNTQQFGLWFMNIAEDVLNECGLSFCKKTLIQFTATVKKHYRELPYHNWVHAFSVTHFMHLLLRNVKDKIHKLEAVAMIFSCLCHDLDHRGKSNAFIQNTQHPIAVLYGESLMENHHNYMTRFILETEGCNVFSEATKEQQESIFKSMRGCIIATDLLKYFGYRESLSKAISDGTFSWDNDKNRFEVICMMMTLSDLCGSCKPWKCHHVSALKVFQEFYAQAEEEMSLGKTTLPMFLNKDDFPINQIGFISGIVKPCVVVLMPLIPSLIQIEEQLQLSLKQWEQKARESVNPETMEALAIPGDLMKEKSISFIKYNCSGIKSTVLDVRTSKPKTI